MDSVVRFRLPDQFGHLHDAAEYRGRPYYLVAAGRGGRDAATAWATALPRVLAAVGRTPPAVVPVANLSGVPRLLRGFVRGRFPKDPRQAVLLDWTGALFTRLAFDPARCTVVVVDAAGRPVLRTSTLATDTAAIAEFVRRADVAAQAATATRR